MGILNVTPDSFYDGGKYSNEKSILSHTEKMLEEGATIIDIGANSTRPGSEFISESDELTRLMPVLEILRKNFSDTIFSIDTFRSNVVETITENFGDFIINDISAGTFDNKMFETIAEKQLPYILMHIQGQPKNMQKNPTYKDISNEILKYFSEKVDKLKILGVNDIIVDPGFGFGKSLEHNYELLDKLDNFKILELPICVGFSRKSMIHKLLNISPNESLNGTTVLNTIAVQNGASILRVHDVKEALETIKIFNMFKNTSLEISNS
ncbi:MAG: dihydropteroate synthase [Bacteroidetes bacterium]|jgi:dihydropteroate synthase|nr:dihydropteroate synthase [Bacteroidota bacterium]MBT6686780.1 dihydropteroate synthase [Bacteroidota bacterium]MBT7141981.1 dihydropteroate synthase [Bacteroidota bacterium]MBT7492509.1 dihydropteroate synthase [Bacteroidota bacterium]